MSKTGEVQNREIRFQRDEAARLAPRPRSTRRWALDAQRRRMLAVSDMSSLVLVTLAVAPPAAWTLMGVAALVAALPIGLLTAKTLGLYDRDHRVLRVLTTDEFGTLIGWALVVTVLQGFVAQQLLGVPLGDELALRAAVLCIVAALSRAAARRIWRQVTHPERVLIVGDGPNAQALRRKIELFPDMHLHCPHKPAGGFLHDRHGVARMAEAYDLTQIDRILVSVDPLDHAIVTDLLALCRAEQMKLGIVPPPQAAFGTAVLLDRVADLPLVQYSTWDTARSTLLLKRCLDVAVSATMLVILTPLLLVIAAAIKLDSRGPVFFVQLRAGRDRQPFRMAKFRTMVADAEHRLPELVDFEQLIDPVFKIERDPRVTRVGRLLRRTSLDELPQLFNVLVGSMSIVGPRPEQLELVERYPPEHLIRFAVKPGLTGPMQVYGRGHLSFDERLAVDRDYVENLSIARDLSILLMTIGVVLHGRGAY